MWSINKILAALALLIAIGGLIVPSNIPLLVLAFILLCLAVIV